MLSCLEIATDARPNDFDAMAHNPMVDDPDGLCNGSRPDQLCWPVARITPRQWQQVAGIDSPGTESCDLGDRSQSLYSYGFQSGLPLGTSGDPSSNAEASADGNEIDWLCLTFSGRWSNDCLSRFARLESRVGGSSSPLPPRSARRRGRAVVDRESSELYWEAISSISASVPSR